MPSSDRPYHCPIYRRGFRSDSSLKRHMVEHATPPRCQKLSEDAPARREPLLGLSVSANANGYDGCVETGPPPRCRASIRPREPRLTSEQERIWGIADKLALKLWPAVLPLLQWDRNNPAARPDLIGSGVLVQVGHELFIFSAAHVLAEFKDKIIWINSNETLVPLEGVEGEYQLGFTGHPDLGDHQKDPVDAAVLRVPATLSCGLAAPVIGVTQLDALTRKCRDERYLLLGYTANRTVARKPDARARDVTSERKPLVLFEVRRNIYQSVGYDERTHLLLEWRNQWSSQNGIHGAWKMNGASGGGIWRFDPRTGEDEVLAATLTELESRKGKKFFVGTRTHIHRDLVAGCCPNLRPLLGPQVIP